MQPSIVQTLLIPYLPCASFNKPQRVAVKISVIWKFLPFHFFYFCTVYYVQHNEQIRSLWVLVYHLYKPLGYQHDVFDPDLPPVYLSLHKKWSFPLRISSVNVTKSAGFLRIWSHLLKKSLIENNIFCAVCYKRIYHMDSNIYWQLIQSLPQYF